jgi:hypothetical protein
LRAHGKELLTFSHPEEHREITSVLDTLDPFPHGEVKNKTPKTYIAEEFKTLGWDLETKIPFSTGKKDYCDLSKNHIFIEQEYSRFEMFFRDFFRFLLLRARNVKCSLWLRRWPHVNVHR